MLAVGPLPDGPQQDSLRSSITEEENGIVQPKIEDAISTVSSRQSTVDRDGAQTDNLTISSEVRTDRVRNVRSMSLLFMGVFSIYGFFLIIIATSVASLRLWTCPVINLPYIPIWITIATGLLMVLLGLIGIPLVLYGLSRGLFKAFSILIGITWAGLVVILVLSATFDSNINDFESDVFTQRITNLFVEAKSALLRPDFNKNPDIVDCWEHLQSTLHCCGASIYSDWWLLGNPNLGTDFEHDPDVGDYNSTTPSAQYDADNSTLVDEVVKTGNTENSNPFLPLSCRCSGGISGSFGHLCSSIDLFNASTLNMSTVLVYNQGCIGRVRTVVSQHLTVFKIITPMFLLLQLFQFVVTTYLSVRNNRLSSVDIYSQPGSTHARQETVLTRIQRYVA